MTAKTKVLAGGVVVLAAALLYWQFGRGNKDEGDGGGSGKPVAGDKRQTSDGTSATRSKSPASLSGTVRAAGGDALAAVVQLNPIGDSRVEPQVVVAGGDGRFAFTDIEPGRYQVAAALAGFLPALSDELELAPGASRTVALELEAGGNPVAGTISDITGGPVANAFVRLTPIAGILATRPARAFSAVTDAAGKFSASAADGVYVLSAHHPDYVPGRRRVELAGGNRELDLALVPGGVVEGVVRFRADDKPAAGAIVRYRRETVSRGFGGAMRQFRDGGRVVADASGKFRITGAGAGLLTLEAETSNAVSTDEVAVPLGIGENRDGISIYLDGAHRISGVVVDKAGNPVAGANVVAMAAGGGADAETDKAGAFRLGPLPPGSYRVSAMPSGGFVTGDEGTPVVIKDKDIDGLRIETDSSVTISGRVEPAAEASVSIAWDAGEMGAGAMPMVFDGTDTKTDGTFEIGPVLPGAKVPLRAVSADGRLGELTVTVPEGGAKDVVISLEEAAAISGRVTDQASRPISGATVSVVAKRAGVRRTVMINGTEVSARRAVTSPDGSFTVVGLEAGDYEVSVKSDTGQPLLWAKPANKAMPTAPIELAVAEREQKTGVALVVETLDGELRGVVTDKDGKPAADVFVTATPSLELEAPAPSGEDGEEEEHGETHSETMMVMETDGEGLGGAMFTRELPPVVTDADGRFVIRGLRRGNYDLVAEGRGGTARGFATKVKTGTDVKIALQPLTVLEGVVTANDEPVAEFSLSLSGPMTISRGVRDEAGTFTIRRLDPGQYALVARSPDDGETTMKVDVVAGEPTKVEVKLQGQVKLRGRLLDADGKPMSGVLIMLIPPQPDGRMEIRLDSSQMPPRTADDGHFVVKTLPGEYMLLGLKPGQGPVHQQSITVKDEADLGDITASGGPSPPPPPPE